MGDVPTVQPPPRHPPRDIDRLALPRSRDDAAKQPRKYDHNMPLQAQARLR